MKNVIIINSYANTDLKKTVLENSILKLKKLNIDIVLISNIFVDTKIQSLVNYFIYNSENLLLPKEKSPIKWFADHQETIHIYSMGTSYMCCKNILLSLKMCEIWGYKSFLYLEYDNYFSDEDLNKINDIFNKSLLEKKIWICNFKNEYNQIFYESRLFAGDITFFLENIKLPNSINEWQTIEPYASSSDTLELIFPKIMQHLNEEYIFFTNVSVCEFFKNSQIDLIHAFSSVNIAYNSEFKDSPILFIVTEEGKYEIFLNDECIYNNKHLRNNLIKLKLKIGDVMSNVYVKLNDKLIFKTHLNINNIDNYKQTCVRYKL